MSWIENALTRLEARLRMLIEGTSTRDGFPRRLHRVLERDLIHAMRAGLRQLSDEPGQSLGKRIAPDQYTLVLPTVEAQILLTHPTELDRLIDIMQDFAVRMGIIFKVHPTLRVVADPHSVKLSILPEFCDPELGNSSTFQLSEPDEVRQMPNGKLPNAYLIVNGLKTFVITCPVVNIGRDPSNQLQLKDPRISRQHAQLRLVHGHFVIFDLDSRDGTFVNGVPVSSHALNPGDVIQLAGVPLVYGQETSLPASQTQELPANPPPPEVL